MVDKKPDIEARLRDSVTVPPTEAAWTEIVARSHDLMEVSTSEPEKRVRWLVPVAAGLIAALGITAAWTANQRSDDGPTIAVAGEPAGYGEARGSAPSTSTTIDDPTDITDEPTKIDVDAEVPTARELEQLFATALTCLEQAGFKTYGPVPRPDGSGFAYLVSSEPGAPTLPPNNTCEAPTHSANLAFAERSSAAQRLEIVAEFNEVARCIGIDKTIAATLDTVGSLVADPVAEGQILDALTDGEGWECIPARN